MREIKFRAWDKRIKEMLHNVFLVGSRIYEGEPLMWIEFEGGMNKLFQGEIMQFTGLKDKNGKEIYEGDIVKSLFRGEDKEVIGEIIWADAGFFIGYKEFKDDMYAWAFYKVIEVIGNIYENKELLEVN